MKKIMLLVPCFLMACLLAFTAGYSLTSLAADNTIKIAHRSFAEHRIVGQLLSLYLESKGYKTEVSEYPNITQIFHELERGDADVYAEYTGTLYTNILNQSKTMSEDDTYNYVKNHLEDEYGITLLNPMGWNNTYVLSVRPQTAEKYQLKRISDIIPVADELVLGSDMLFANRKDGLIGLKEAYTGLNFKGEKAMDQARTYQALIDGNTDINASYSTDAEIEKYGLVNLIDDKKFFPPYYLTPLLKIQFAETNPEVVTALKELGNKWSEAEMMHYNLLVNDGQNPRTVAEMMLRDKGLI